MDNFVRKLSKKSADFVYDSASERPTKRRKQDEIGDSEAETDSQSSPESEDRAQRETRRNAYSRADGKAPASHEVTAVENVLPPTQIDDEAIKQYEHMKASQLGAEIGETAEKTKPIWVKGRSSIYVDAFNLALDTVLDEESQLFDEKEMQVFREWKQLDYEAQYLSVFCVVPKHSTILGFPTNTGLVTCDCF